MTVTSPESVPIHFKIIWNKEISFRYIQRYAKPSESDFL